MDLSPNMVNDVHKQPGKFDKLQLWMIDDKLTIFMQSGKIVHFWALYKFGEMTPLFAVVFYG